MQNKKVLATFAALGAQVIFGFSFMFTKIALGSASPLTVIADRYIMAFVGMSVAMIFTKTKLKLNKGNVIICGCGFDIVHFENQLITVKGKITSLEFSV